MLVNATYLQPIGAAAAPSNTNPGATADIAAPATDSDGGVPLAVDAQPAPQQTGASQEFCEKANSEATLATIGYSVGASILALLIFIVLEKKHVSSAGTRFGFGVMIGGVAAASLAFFDPGRSDHFRLCLNDPANSAYITLGTQPVARALAFGFVPALVLTLLLCFIARRMIR
ncbi:MAG: hypothetical protein WCJ30_03995 [Deltaproteobacteria bacterium]